MDECMDYGTHIWMAQRLDSRVVVYIEGDMGG
jgi:hypothetical protein